MVSKWTYNDFITPKVKAEIIVDMLISEFIEDILNCRDFNDCCGNDGTAEYLAKEFPIPGYSKEEQKEGEYIVYKESKVINSPSVDYLVSKGKKLYLVELKTNSDSFEPEQLFRMIMAKEHTEDKKPVEKLLDHYAEVLLHTDSKTKYYKQAEYMWKQVNGEKLPFEISDMRLSTGNDKEKKNKEKKIILQEHLKQLSDKFTGGIDIVYLTLDKCKNKMSGEFKSKETGAIIEIGKTEKVSDITEKITYTFNGKKNNIYIVRMNNIGSFENASKNKLWKQVKIILDDLPADKI